MRSNNKALILAALALGGCSSGWWSDAPAAPPAPASAPVAETGGLQPAYPEAGYTQPGASYPAEPGRPQQTVPAYDAAPPPAQAVRYDNVGYAVWSNEAGTIAAAHPTLPPGSFVEVTALDTGKTILVPITATSGGGREIELSGAAALELGLGSGSSGAVRVRAANPSGADLSAFRLGRPAPARPDTPPVLLNALKRKLAGTLGQPGGNAPPARQPMPSTGQRPPAGYVPSVPARSQAQPAPRAPAARAPAAGPGYYVQVAALSDPTRAAAIARQVGGAVSSGGGFHRVRFGPFDDLRTAQAARDDVAARGYADARIVRQD